MPTILFSSPQPVKSTPDPFSGPFLAPLFWPPLQLKGYALAVQPTRKDGCIRSIGAYHPRGFPPSDDSAPTSQQRQSAQRQQTEARRLGDGELHEESILTPRVRSAEVTVG